MKCEMHPWKIPKQFGCSVCGMVYALAWTIEHTMSERFERRPLGPFQYASIAHFSLSILEFCNPWKVENDSGIVLLNEARISMRYPHNFTHKMN